MATIPIWDDLYLTTRRAVLAYAWAVIGNCSLLIVAWLIRGAGAVRKRKFMTAAVFMASVRLEKRRSYRYYPGICPLPLNSTRHPRFLTVGHQCGSICSCHIT